MKKFAVILSGCGYLDGAEIRESVLTFLALDSLSDKVSYESFALDEEQHDVMDHLTGKEMESTRNILTESARITRGNIKNLEDLVASEFDGIILPGGFGVAKSFSSFASAGHMCSVNALLDSTIKNFYQEKKLIGAICISPAIIGKVLAEIKPHVSIGHDETTAKEIELTGAIHHPTKVDEFYHDQENRIFSTPAYMYSSPNLKDVYTGIFGMIEKMVLL